MNTMAPIDRLIAAADLLDKRASEATEGPWEVGTINDRITPPQTWHLEGVERWRGLRNNVNLGEDEATARYIATMHPEVGKLVAASMREAAYTIERNAQLVAQGRPMISIASAFLLDLADLLLAGDRS